MKTIIKKSIRKVADNLGYQLIRKHEGKSFDSEGYSPSVDTPIVLLGTYHKTGTVWLRSVFEDIASKTGRQFIDVSQKYYGADKELLKLMDSAKPGSIIFECHTQFPKIEPTERYRGLRMIRDPRDVALSALRYHRKSAERWLHVAMPEFNGKTYQQAINAITTPVDSLKFELNNSAGNTINKMLNFDNHHAFKTVKYETMVSDVNMVEWLQVFVELGFKGEELAECLSSVWKNSLFGKKKAEGNHILNGTISQWETNYSDEMKRAFYQVFPDACTILGYENIEQGSGGNG